MILHCSNRLIDDVHTVGSTCTRNPIEPLSDYGFTWFYCQIFFSRNRRGPKCSSCTTSRFLSSHIAHDKHIDAFHVAPHSLRRGSDVYFNAMQVLRPARNRIGRKRIPQSNKWKYQINLLISVHWTDEWIRAHVLTSPDSSFEWCDSSLALFFSQIC